MQVHGIGHVNLRASADTIERLRRFYVDVLGLHEGARPVFRSGSRGYWLYANDRAVLHLTIAQNGGADSQPPGVFNHLAFDCNDLDATRARLERAGIRYETDVVDELHQTQLFLSDPAGMGVELTFTQSD
jgi:catechol 2,3-dioxygenase-like lactoylglutathione lyase family enzyme